MRHVDTIWGRVRGKGGERPLNNTFFKCFFFFLSLKMECFLSKPVFESSVIYLENRWRREKAWEIGEENKLLIDFFFFLIRRACY